MSFLQGRGLNRSGRARVPYYPNLMRSGTGGQLLSYLNKLPNLMLARNKGRYNDRMMMHHKNNRGCFHKQRGGGSSAQLYPPTGPTFDEGIGPNQTWTQQGYMDPLGRGAVSLLWKLQRRRYWKERKRLEAEQKAEEKRLREEEGEQQGGGELYNNMSSSSENEDSSDDYEGCGMYDSTDDENDYENGEDGENYYGSGYFNDDDSEGQLINEIDAKKLIGGEIAWIGEQAKNALMKTSLSSTIVNTVIGGSNLTYPELEETICQDLIHGNGALEWQDVYEQLGQGMDKQELEQFGEGWVRSLFRIGKRVAKIAWRNRRHFIRAAKVGARAAKKAKKGKAFKTIAKSLAKEGLKIGQEVANERALNDQQKKYERALNNRQQKSTEREMKMMPKKQKHKKKRPAMKNIPPLASRKICLCRRHHRL